MDERGKKARVGGKVFVGNRPVVIWLGCAGRPIRKRACGSLGEVIVQPSKSGRLIGWIDFGWV